MNLKKIASYYNELKEDIKKSRFMFSKVKHTTGQHAEENVLEKGMTAATNLMTTGLSFVPGMNFVLPNNLFWNECFCIIATTKSFVRLDDPA
jgi:hypothetical protein